MPYLGSSSAGATAIVTAVAAATLSFVLLSRSGFRTNKPASSSDEDEIEIELVECEKVLYGRDEPPISTLTW